MTLSSPELFPGIRWVGGQRPCCMKHLRRLPVAKVGQYGVAQLGAGENKTGEGVCND